MTFNDKHQIELETEEFVRSSRQWIIHPKYENSIGNNYDLCLVKLDQPLDLITGKFLNIPINMVSIEGSIYVLYKEIPCILNDFKAKTHHGAACWVAGWGASRYNGRSERHLKSIGLNLMDVDFCRTHSFYESHILQNDELCAGLPPNEDSKINIHDERVINAAKDSCQGQR